MFKNLFHIDPSLGVNRYKVILGLTKITDFIGTIVKILIIVKFLSKKSAIFPKIFLKKNASEGQKNGKKTESRLELFGDFAIIKNQSTFSERFVPFNPMGH
ncbi:MAG: hypothetical protein IJQ31_05385 [Thermoguttaceae bacterium]|nr:hypothetical protein [Thermoguttaceae bacterium]